MCYSSVRIALLGSTGVGKDTCISIIKSNFTDKRILVIRLADPLYQAQAAIYEICKRNKEFWSQDGELLNFLGQHMRKVNPTVIKESFQNSLQASAIDVDLIICPDARPIDIPFIKESGFTIIHIYADAQITLERRKKRGDISLGQSNHSTEQGINPLLYDHQISNNGSLAELHENITKLLMRIIP